MRAPQFSAARLRAFFAAIIALLFVIGTNDARAQSSRDWQGNDNGNWNWNNQWAGGVAPTAGDRIYFVNNNNVVTTNNSSVNIGQVFFQSGATTARTIVGGVNLTDWNSGGQLGVIENNSTGSHTVNGGVGLNAGNYAYQINPRSGALTINGGVTNLTTSKSLQVYGDNTLTINGGITGTGGVFAIKNSATVNLNGGSTYTGNTEIDGGNLVLGGSLSSSSMVFLGSGATNLNATLTLNNNNTNFSNAIQVNSGSGTRTLVKDGAGSQTMNGSVFTNNNALTVNVNNSTGVLAITNLISGSGSINKTGTGTLILLGGTANSMSGAMTNAAGTLILNKTANTAAIAGALTIASGATLRTDAANQLNNQLVTVNGTFNMNSQAQSLALAGSGSITLGSATMTINNSGNDSFTGGISGTGGLIKTGVGTQTLSSLNSYTGTVQINQGTLSIAAESGLGGTVASLTNNMLQFGGGTLAVTGSFTMSSNRGITLNSGGGTIDVATGQTLTYGGLLTGASGNDFTKTGAGGLTLSANNSSSLAGSFRILGGTVTITNVNSLGSGVLELGATTTQGVLVVNSNNTRSQNILITDNSTNSVISVASGQALTTTGSLTQGGAFANTTKFGKAGAGTLILAGSSGNSYNGQIQIGGGTVIAGTSTALGTNTGTGQRAIDLGLDISDAVSANNVALLASNGVTVGNSFFVAGNGGTRTIGLAGSGSATFSNQFFMNGNLIVDAGSSASDSVTISGNLTNSGGIIKTNAGILVLSASNNHSGGTTLGQGTLRINDARALGSGTFTISGPSTIDNTSGAAITLANNNPQSWNADFTFAGTTNLNLGTGAVTLGASRQVTVSANNLTVGGIISGTGFGLTKAGAGTLTLSGVNTYTGNTTINNGVLSVGAAGNLGNATGNGAITLGGGTLVTTAGMTLGSRGITVSSGSGINVATGGLTNTAGLFGSGALAKTGSGTLSLTNTSGSYNGTITISGGTLQANTGTSLGSANVTVGSTGTLMGAATLGAVTVQSGGTIAPGNSPGTLSVSSLVLEGGGSYAWELTDATGTPGVGYDVIAVSGAVTNNATALNQFTINIIGTNPSNWNSATDRFYDIITAGSAWSPSFSTNGLAINTSQFTAGGTLGTWALTNNGNNLRLLYTAPGVTWVFNNSVAASQGTDNVTTNGNTAAQLATITNSGSAATAVIISNTAPMSFTNPNNSYSGTTVIEQGTLVATVNSLTNANGAFGNANSAITVGSSTTSSNANLLIGASGVEVGRAITINGGGSGTRTIGATNASGTATFSGNIAMSTNVTLSASSSAGTTLFSGVLSGSGAITAAGSGQVVLSGANTYTNATTVNNGTTLVAANNAALGAGAGTTTVTSGGTLALSNNINEDEAITISGTGVGGNGALRNLSGANTNSGLVTLGAASTLSSDAGSLTLSGGINGATFGITLGGSGNTLVSGVISNTAAGITKTGAGTATLSALNTFTGTASVQAGTLSITNGTALDNAVNVAVSSGATFEVNTGETISGVSGAGNVTLNAQLRSRFDAASNNLSGTISGTGNFLKGGTGTITLAGANSFSGGVTNEAGTILIGNNSALGSGTFTVDFGNTTNKTVAANGSSSFTLSQSNRIFNDLTLGQTSGNTGRLTFSGGTWLGDSGGPRILTVNGTQEFSGAIVGSNGLTKTGAGSLVLSGANAYQGQTTHSAGALIIGNNAALGTGVYQVDFADASTKVIAASGTGSFTISQNNNIFNDLTIGEATGNTGKLTFAGTTFLGNENDTRTITVLGVQEFSGAVTGGRGILKRGSGTLMLSGVNTFTNGIFIDAGAVDLAGGSLSSGIIDVGGGANGSSFAGSNSVLRISANSTFGRTITINGETNSSGNSGDRSIVFANSGGTATLSGDVNIEKGFGINVTNSGATAILSGALTGGGGPPVTVSGNGTLGLTSLSSSTTARWLVESGATLAIGNLRNLGELPGGYYINKVTLNGGTLSLTNGLGLTNIGIGVTANSTISVGSGLIATNPAAMGGSGNITKSGSGNLVLDAANTNTGRWTVSAGTLTINAANNLGNATGGDVVTLNGGRLRSENNIALGNRGITVGAGGGTISVASFTRLTNTNGLNGAGSLVKEGGGLLALSNNSSSDYTGSLTVTNGTLQVNTTLRGASIGVGNGSIAAGSVLMGAGSVGAVTVDSNGRISPGNSVGILSVSTNLSFNAGGSYLWEIVSTNVGGAGTGWDLISVDTAAVNDGLGTLDINGAFTIAGTNIGVFTFNTQTNYAPFLIVRAGTINGSLANLSFSSLGSSLGVGGNWSFTNVVGGTNGLYAIYTAPTASLVFTNDFLATQGDANLVTNNNAGDLATIVDQGGVTAVVISNSAPVTFTNGANSYTGATTIEAGTLATTVNAGNAGGAFGVNSANISLGALSGSSNASILIGAADVDVSKGIDVRGGGTGVRTIGATNSTGTAIYSGAISTLANVTLSAANSNATTRFAGAIGGSGALTVSGSGTVTLAGANTFTNSVTVNSNATLVAANNSALGLGSGATTVSNFGTLAFSGNINEDEAITIAGTGVGGNGALRNISGANTNTGTITLSANSTIAVDAGSSLTMSNIDISGTNNRSVTIAGAGNSTIRGGVTTFGGSLTNNIIKDGSGTLTVNNNGTSGTAQLNIVGGTVTIAGGSVTTSTNTGTRAIDLGISGLTATTNNVALFANSGVTVSNSIYVAPAGAGGLGTRTVGTESDSGTATFNNEIFLGGNLSLFAATGGTAAFSGAILGAGNLTKSGGGIATLSANNTFAGDVDIASGRLNVSGNNAIGNSAAVTVSNGATFGISSLEEIGSLSGAGTVSLDALLISGGNGTNDTFSGQFTGGGGFVKKGAGSMTLSGASSATGETFLVNGTLIFATNQGGTFTNTIQLGETGGTDNATLVLGGSGVALANAVNVRSGSSNNTLTIDARNTTGTATIGALTLGKNADVRAAAGGGLNITGSITGANTLAKRGAGTVTLSATNNSGATRYDLWEGELQIGQLGNIGNAGTLTENRFYMDGGALGVTGNVSLDGNNGLFLGSAGGTIRVATNATLTLEGLVQDGGNTNVVLNKTGAGTLFLSRGGSTGLDGAGSRIVVNEGTLSSWNPGILPSSVQLGSSTAATTGTYNFTKTDGGVTAANNFSVNSGGGAISVTDDTLTLSGVISGSGALSKTSGGILTLSGNNTYSGALTVSGGTLNLNRTGSQALGSVGSVNVASGATLLISQNNQVNDSAAITLSGGTIRRGGNVSELFGSLNLTTASFLDYGAANNIGTMTFTGTYTPSALLTVNNFLPGSRLQFGNTISAADLNNTSLFSFSNGFRTSTEDGFFTITAIPEPSTYLAAAGLLAMFLWPMRRRLVKDAKSIFGLRATGRDRSEAYRNA